jgi:hypothetical protein
MHFRKQNTYMHRHSISQKHHTISHFSCDTCHIPTRCHREKIFKLKTTWIFALYTALRVSWGVLEVMPLGSSSGRHLLVELPAPRAFPYTYCYQFVNNLLCLGEHNRPQVKCRTISSQ